jgi:ParB family chromosome partitioning protein
MRHDRHYVDELFGRDTGVMVEEISLEKIKPNPDQPRKDMGDLEGLANSIREQGVLEPILVNKGDQGQYIIISGERRFQASRLLETETIPCIVKNLEANQTLEVALVENLQRKDLHPFEEADGLRSLITTFQYTHEDIARKIGKSRSTVTEALAIAQLVGEVREASGEAGIHAKSMLLEIAKLKSVDEQLALIEKIASGAGREEVRRQNKKSQRAKPFVFKYQDPSKTFSFNLRFRKSEVEQDELIGVLENILEDLRNQ